MRNIGLDWRNNGELLLKKLLETGENQLLLVSAAGSVKPIFTTIPGVKILGGVWTPTAVNAWSPNGQHFIFITEDSNNEEAQVYLWDFESEESMLIHTLSNDQSFQNVNWLPDSTGVYFTSGESSLRYDAVWFYDVELKDLQLVAPSIN